MIKLLQNEWDRRCAEFDTTQNIKFLNNIKCKFEEEITKPLNPLELYYKLKWISKDNFNRQITKINDKYKEWGFKINLEE